MQCGHVTVETSVSESLVLVLIMVLVLNCNDSDSLSVGLFNQHPLLEFRYKQEVFHNHFHHMLLQANHASRLIMLAG